MLDRIRVLLENDKIATSAIAVALGVFTWLAVYVLAKLVLRALARLAAKTRTELDDELIDRLQLPGRWLGPVAGVHVAAHLGGLSWVAGVAEVVEGLLATYALVAAFEILIIEQWLRRRQGIVVPPLVRQVAIGVIYGCVLLGVVGEVFGIDITPLLATTSVTTVVLGLALQGPLSNLFSGLVLHLEHQPRVGDWVLIDGREGCIHEIGWRSTRLQLLSHDILVVPNASIVNAQMVNFSAPTPMCGRQIPVPVPLDVAPKRFEAMVFEILAKLDGIVPGEAHRAWLVGIDDHCQRYVVRFFVSEFRRHDDIESEFLKALWYRFHEEGLAFPTPHQAVRMVTTVPPAFAGLDPVRRAFAASRPNDSQGEPGAPLT